MVFGIESELVGLFYMKERDGYFAKGVRRIYWCLFLNWTLF